MKYHKPYRFVPSKPSLLSVIPELQVQLLVQLRWAALLVRGVTVLATSRFSLNLE